jgi:hypothetical protein
MGGRFSSARARAGLGLVAAIAIAATATPPSAQSLADVARAETARRAAVKHPGRVITDKDLEPARPARPTETQVPGTHGGAASDAALGSAPRPTTAADAGTEEPSRADAAGRPPIATERRDEQYWRQRFAATRQAVARAEQDVSAVEGRTRELARALEEPATGARHGELSAERATAERSLEGLQRRLGHVRTELAALEALARNLNVPTDWTR